ncbi:MAG: sugar ABC transporter ATP-binding protein [Planctomycetota bacterium]|jgi:simple sugar transport system ATP-binding protein|nr:sugar ABC transporter ATP-binding protein [Planctomycetota bacterium]
MTFLELKGIRKSFDGVHALKGVDFTVEEGEVHGLVGENGSGKSTLMKIIAGVYTPDEGQIRLDGRLVTDNSPFFSSVSGISVIYQDLSLFPNLTVVENIYMGKVVSDPGKFVNPNKYIQTAIDALNGLGVAINPYDLVEMLPIAKQQLIAIARALTNKTRLLILDEPTTALTRKEILQLFGILGRLKEKGISFIFISHKLDEVLEICDRVTVLRDGGLVGAEAAKNLAVGDLEAMMLGKSLTFERKTSSSAKPDEALRLERLTKKNNFADVSLTVKMGEIVGLSGLLGSGRTELALALFGIAPADSGKIFVNGRESRIESVDDAMARGIAYVPEDRLLQGLVMDHAIGDNIVLATQDDYLKKSRLIDRKAMQSMSERWIRDLGIKTDSSRKSARVLSGGNQQKVVVAKWLAMNPAILILDSPTVGIDVGAKSALYETIRESAGKGMAILMISDEMPELLSNCDRIYVMRNGRMIREFDAQKITEADLRGALEMSGSTSFRGVGV